MAQSLMGWGCSLRARALYLVVVHLGQECQGEKTSSLRLREVMKPICQQLRSIFLVDEPCKKTYLLRMASTNEQVSILFGDCIIPNKRTTNHVIRPEGRPYHEKKV